MANAAVDWTVDKLLSGVSTLNNQASTAQTTLREARTRYLLTLRSLPQIPNVAAREALRGELGKWIVKQVDAENRFNSFAATLASAKAKVKAFLQSVNITPPGYLGAIQIAVPIAVAAAIAAALVIGAAIVAYAVNQSKGLGILETIAQNAKQQNWTPQQLDTALKDARSALDATKPPNPLDLTGALKAALPVVALIAAVLLLGPMMKRRTA